MNRSLSPLRYPGGKFKIYNRVKKIIETNTLGNKSYVEPFAGGFAIGLKLLHDKVVETAILNDLDPHIYNFWHTILYHTDEFISMMESSSITINERKRQKEIYDDVNATQIEDGFATFFLNRVNFSGVITGGPIGGFNQTGKYKLNCRFNKDEIKKKIRQISLFRNRIELYNHDANKLIAEQLREKIQDCFFYLDPPYVKKGHKLYANYFEEEDHRVLKNTIAEHLKNSYWIVTYDDCELVRDIYEDYNIISYNILHSTGGSVQGKEVVITNIHENQFEW